MYCALVRILLKQYKNTALRKIYGFKCMYKEEYLKMNYVRIYIKKLKKNNKSNPRKVERRE